MFEPNKFEYVERIRTSIDGALLKLPLPKVHPNIVSILSIFTSLLFVLSFTSGRIDLSFFFIIVTLLLDWLDGLIAKKYNMSTRNGYIVDIVSDRISEAIMLVPFSAPWLYLVIFNSSLAIITLTYSKHLILPLRQVFLVYFFFSFIV